MLNNVCFRVYSWCSFIVLKIEDLEILLLLCFFQRADQLVNLVLTGEFSVGCR
jgi:hypothetical protein